MVTSVPLGPLSPLPRVSTLLEILVIITGLRRQENELFVVSTLLEILEAQEPHRVVRDPLSRFNPS